MIDRYKKYIKLNLIPIFFIAVSFISVTLAWFAYSGLAKVETDINVKAWYIEFAKDNQVVSNDIVINLADINPGMEAANEKIDIRNKGDSAAQITYEITSARLLDEVLDLKKYTSEEIEDKLSHDFPMHVNLSLTKKYIEEINGESTFEGSVSWPLDSGDDEADSIWGKRAYDFIKNEQEKSKKDSNYQVKPPIEIIITIKAEQYIDSSESLDYNYNSGDIVLIDTINNKKCNTISSNCIKTYVIDSNNKVGDNEVTLLPDLFKTYQDGTYYSYNNSISSFDTWNVHTRSLEVKDLLKVISNDIENSYIKSENYSEEIIGLMNNEDRIGRELEKVKQKNAYYTFTNNNYLFLSTSKCYWTSTEYDSENAFALKKIDDNTTKIYKENKNTNCSIVPVIIASKAVLR